MAQNEQFLSKAQSEARKLEVMSNWLMPESTAMLRTAVSLALIITGWVSGTVEVFLRHQFGERYLSVFRVINGLLGMTFIIFIASALLGMSTNMTAGVWFTANAATSLLTIAYFCMAVYHRYRIRQRNRAGIQWHTMSFGISRLEPLVNRYVSVSRWTVYCFVEPAVCFILGFLLSRIAPLTLIGSWLLVASFSLFIHNNLVHMHQRNRMLDITDSQIEGRYFQEALEQKPLVETSGFAVVPAISAYKVDTPPMDRAATVGEVMRRTAVSANANGHSPSSADFDDTVNAVMQTPQAANSGSDLTGRRNGT